MLSAGADEVPYVYKNIEAVMRDQTDLVESVARFDPKIVKMCDDGSKADSHSSTRFLWNADCLSDHCSATYHLTPSKHK